MLFLTLEFVFLGNGCHEMYLLIILDLLTSEHAKKNGPANS